MFEHLMIERMHQPEVKTLPYLEKVRESEAFRHEAEEIVARSHIPTRARVVALHPL
jgi:hypothetical protein